MSVLHANGKEIHEQIQIKNTVLVDCWAPWCPPCRMIASVLEEVYQEYKLPIVKVNADENEEFISEYGVLGLPTLLLFRNGQLVNRITGFQPKPVLVEALKDNRLIE